MESSFCKKYLQILPKVRNNRLLPEIGLLCNCNCLKVWICIDSYPRERLMNYGLRLFILHNSFSSIGFSCKQKTSFVFVCID